MKGPVFLVIHMCPMAKAHESVGRHAKLAVSEATQLRFPIPNLGDPPGTPMDLKKNLSFLFNLFKSESVERTHL